VGVSVHTVARICGLAHGGQILISRAALASVGDQMPAGVSVLDLGEQHLRGLGAQSLFQLSASDLPATFPPLSTGIEQP